MKKLLSAILSVSMIAGMCSTTTITASALEKATSQYVEIAPFASNQISSISYSCNSSYYSADVTLRASYSGTIYIELQKKNGSKWDYVTSKSGSFSSSRFPYLKHTRSTSSGTYRVYVQLTYTGVSDAEDRYSDSYTI